MTPQEAQELVKQGKALLIDVREEDEVQSGLAEGAVWMPLSEMIEDTDAWRSFKRGLPEGKALVFYCKVGGRAGRMAEFLACEGFATHNIGGLCDWKAAGLPTQAFRK